MHESTKLFQTSAIHSSVTIQRDDNGVPHIQASDREDLLYAIGYAHGNDRIAQMMQLRAIALGKTSEFFLADDDLIELDKYMRWLWLEKGVSEELGKLSSASLKSLSAYTAGVNQSMEDNARPLEFWVMNYHPHKWRMTDTFLLAKLMSFLGLSQTQGDAEKLIIQLIQHDVSPDKVKALFPAITEEIDVELIKQIRLRKPVVPQKLLREIAPNLRASNNWVVNHAKSATGSAILACDPHMEVNRLPPLWYELEWSINDNIAKGATLPGIPLIIFGRSKHLAWGNTYGFMDMIDWYMEECEDGRYKVDGEWKQFEKRVEVLQPKGKRPQELVFYENHHGVLDGEPMEAGIYLSMAYTGRDGVGAEMLDMMLTVDEIETVDEARKVFRNLSVPTFNWLIADTQNNIGYQMCGKMPRRNKAISGLLPVMGWKSEYDWKGFVDPKYLPSKINPQENFLATANSDMNEFGKASPVNLSMASYRLQRIRELLEMTDQVNVAYCQQMQRDTYSKQAEKFMPHIEPYIPETANGDILRNWDLHYEIESHGAYLFESIYQTLLEKVFGRYGIGNDLLHYIQDSTALFTNYYGYFDAVLLDDSSVWYEGVDYEEIFHQAVIEGLDKEAKTLENTQKFQMDNIFLGNKLPKFFGFDETDIIMPGGRATIPQIQAFEIFGSYSAVGQIYRMIADLSQDDMLTVLPGGPSGKRFSRWYRSELELWKTYQYKML